MLAYPVSAAKEQPEVNFAFPFTASEMDNVAEGTLAEQFEDVNLAAAAAFKGTWDCGVCTLINDGNDRKCNACGAARNPTKKKTAQKAQVKKDSPPQGKKDTEAKKADKDKEWRAHKNAGLGVYELSKPGAKKSPPGSAASSRASSAATRCSAGPRAQVTGIVDAIRAEIGFGAKNKGRFEPLLAHRDPL
eukprot:2571795-Rhodomonas_salina.1